MSTLEGSHVTSGPGSYSPVNSDPSYPLAHEQQNVTKTAK